MRNGHWVSPSTRRPDFSSGYITTDNQLFALSSDDDTLAARALRYLGVAPYKLHSDDAQILLHQLPVANGRKAPTKRLKHVIDLANEEAFSLRNNYIGTEHLLLGLIRECEGEPGHLSRTDKFQLNIDEAREIIYRLLLGELYQAKCMRRFPSTA